MDYLPEELLLYIATFLEPHELVKLQSLSRRFLAIGRDSNIWKSRCFENSRAEAFRRRQQLMSRIQPHLADLARAVEERNGNASNAELPAHRMAATEKQRALANWDPSYHGEDVNFYQEYIARHAPISTSWLQQAYIGSGDEREHYEATGAGILYDEASRIADRVFAPIDDGSICVWNVSPLDKGGIMTQQGAVVDRTIPGLLAGRTAVSDRAARAAQSKAIMTETGAVECVSVDSRQKKGFFAVMQNLHEVDLSTLQIISTKSYPFSITTLSEARHPTPLTVGTNMTIHLHDSREPGQHSESTLSVRCELIGGKPLKNGFDNLTSGNMTTGHAILSQPGPLSILHLPDREWDGNGDIWVAGRFTSLLNYDRRFFPRLRGTVHSGARLSSMMLLPHPFIPRNLGYHSIFSSNSYSLREAKSVTGHTIVAAGEYKGKGSLELFGLSSDPQHTILSSDSSSAWRNKNACMQNRQTASSSKLLSVATHGARLVYSDGDGNIKWMERDGFTPVRQFNINPDAPQTEPTDDTGLFSTSTQAYGEGDIVQKIMPTLSRSSFSGRETTPLDQDNLLIWTGDGRLGMVGFGNKPAFKQEDFEEAAETAEEEAEREKEKEYGATMRKALERQAADVRFVRGLGLGTSW
ncbi:uncharacterized protein K452DRAFT_253540 [Aplosporella prunicola CBS 121167]|uniref:F-box domain-containing protein n=1 Tax=Aplosporella prunicola CBS 121167 TaxID=1176127 RepID=A0A6A6B6Z7_9PEZI|nr:uncharacterized protein K452DRAFT_253540 [Aplosporella prunicola CBS 121167]KAF2139912.1 hypothetical protein K452DRAFT_253540 [Aplosporella prunicola CBS 121167]